jgi:hypothetical protein
MILNEVVKPNSYLIPKCQEALNFYEKLIKEHSLTKKPQIDFQEKINEKKEKRFHENIEKEFEIETFENLTIRQIYEIYKLRGDA